MNNNDMTPTDVYLGAANDWVGFHADLGDLTRLLKPFCSHCSNAQRREAKIDAFVAENGSLLKFMDDEQEYYERVRRNYEGALTVQNERVALAERALRNVSLTLRRIAQATAPYCICSQHKDDTMIECDKPGCIRQWFHYSCVGFKEEYVPVSKWYCPMCDIKD